MLLRTCLFITTALLLIVPTQPAHADVIRMANGDQLTGRVIKLQDGMLHFETAYAEGVLLLPWQDVERIETVDAVTLQLLSGEVVKGSLQPAADGRVWITGELIPAGELSMSDIRAINPPAEQTATIEGSIMLGGNRHTGNTDRTAASAAVDAIVKDRKHRYTLGLLYNYAEEDDTVSERNAFGRFKYDYFFTRKIYGYLNTELLNDRFKDLNLRTVVGPGVGYQVWDNEGKSLAFEAGLAYFNEDRDEGEDDAWITARLATLFTYKFGSGLVFSEQLTLYPSLENGGEFTLRNQAAITSPLVFGWALQLRSIIDHDSDPESADVEKTDYSWILGLNYGF